MTCADLKKKFGIDLEWMEIGPNGKRRDEPARKAFAVRVRIPTSKEHPARPLKNGWTTAGKVQGSTGDWDARRRNGWILRTGIDTRNEATEIVLVDARKDGQLPK